MPVVEISYSRMRKLVGRTSRKRISEALPFLGLDIESEDGDLVRVEYSPNRPDYSTDYGISLGLQGLLGIRTGAVGLEIAKGGNALAVSSKVAGIRPYVTGIIARGGTVTDRLVRQLMAMQEDLHFGMGRRRKKSSIGMHDLDRISFPLSYTTAKRTHKFVPLNSGTEMSARQILMETEVGRSYGGILGQSAEIPVILDDSGTTVSFPPIINAAATTVTESTRNLFVEVTGISKTGIEDMLSVAALVLQTAGFSLESVGISGAGNSTPGLESRRMNLAPELVRRTLGLDITASEMVSCLQRSRLAASEEDKLVECVVPPYRFDILSEMDLVEEVALGYGIGNIGPRLAAPQTLGGPSPVSVRLKQLDRLLVGLGYTEALNSSLTSERILCGITGRSDKKIIRVLDSKSREHTVLRDSLLPGLVENLSRNIHAPYPQKLFETGTVFKLDNPVAETDNLACVSAHADAGFTEMKSVVQSALKLGFGINVRTRAASHPMFEDGSTATLLAGRRTIGMIGQVGRDILSEYKIRVPVAGFELYLTGLIFD